MRDSFQTLPQIQVLFLGIGKPLPTFIRNRIMQLDRTRQIRITIIIPWDSQNHIQLENGTTLPELAASFKIKRTILPLIWYSIVFVRPSLRLWNALGRFPFRTRARQFVKYHTLVRVRKVDLVHFQWLASSEDIGWVRRFFRVPVVASARGSQLTVYPATDHGYEDKIRKSLVAADYVHAVSQGMTEACVRFGANPDKVFVNYNGIDMERFNSQQRKRNTDEELRLISTGNLMWRKGFIWQLLLVKKLKGNGVKVELKIIGDGPDRQGLNYTIIRLGLMDTVTLEGEMASDEVIKRLQSADIYISTSAAEGLSNAVLEAVACGLPVVAFDCEGMNEVINDGQNGFIVPFGDLETMAEKIVLLNNDRVLLDSLGNKGAKLAAEKFDYRIHIQKMIEFYSSVCLNNE